MPREDALAAEVVRLRALCDEAATYLMDAAAIIMRDADGDEDDNEDALALVRRLQDAAQGKATKGETTCPSTSTTTTPC